MSSYIIVATPAEGAEDFSVIGAFADRDDAIAWMQKAFHHRDWAGYLFRIKELRSKEETKPE